MRCMSVAINRGITIGQVMPIDFMLHGILN